MAKIQYTPAQNAAVHWQGGNLLLSAAAGSGKTATLTGRILWLLEHENVSIREMCIVTYTRAAAAELRDRIASGLRERIRETGSRRLAGQLAELSGAEISTIHAFLYRNLRPLFSALGLSPDFVIGDEAVMKSLRAESMTEIVDEGFDNADASFLKLADALSAARDTQSLDKTLLQIAGALSAAGRSPTDLPHYAEMLSVAKEDADFFTLPQSAALRERLQGAVSHYRSVISETRMAFTPEVEAKYGPSADAFLDWMNRIQNAMDSYEAVCAALCDDRLPRLGALAAKNATDASDQFKKARDNGKKAFQLMRSSLFVYDKSAVLDALTRTSSLLCALEEVLSRFEERYQQKKRAKGLLDYGDLETYALALFTDENGDPTPAAEEVARKYRYIFIDEYQDTNEVQDTIFRAVSGNARRFLVGDIKQSIYRFRGAEPAVFSRYRDRWSAVSPEDASENISFSPEDGASLFMSENFRCDQSVIELVNLTSSLLFPHGAIPYTPADALVMGKTGGGSEQAEICLIAKTTADAEETDAPEERDTRDRDTESDPEAEYVAQRIAELLAHGLEDGTPVSPGDIAILLRSPDSSGEAYRTALTKRHIPVSAPRADPLLVSPAVLLALCMAYTADNPLRDIYIAGTLHSPLFGLTTTELTLLHRSAGEDAPLYIALEKTLFPEKYSDESDGSEENPALDSYAPDTDDPLYNVEQPIRSFPNTSDTENRACLSEETYEKLRRFANALPELRYWARNLTAEQFFERLFATYRFFDLPEVAEDPAEARNLRSLYELARKYGSSGVGAFLQIVETLREDARQESEEISGVTLTSIHKAKGLEYPVVFVAECAKRRNTRDESSDILFDPSLGFGMRLPDAGGYVRCNTILRTAIAEKKRMDAVTEEMRILYVALTRARTKLICTAKVKDPETYLEQLRTEAAYPTQYRITTADSYMEWLLLAALSAPPSHLRKIRLIERDTDVLRDTETAVETAAPMVEVSDALLPAEPFSYPTPEYAAIPTKVPVSRLYPGIVDDWLACREIPIAAPDTETGDDAERSPDAVETESPATPEHPSEEAETDVIAAAMRAHIPLPHFLTGTGAVVTPADRGVATHMFMQFTDLHRLYTDGVDAELDRLVREHYITPNIAAAAYRGQLARFRESRLFLRMRESSTLWREFRFNAVLPAARFTRNDALRTKLTADNVTLTVQGVVDCVFREPDGTLTLVDYKTDHATAEDRANPTAFDEKMRRRHSYQLTCYREICASMFNEPIHRVILYATALGREIQLHENAVANESPTK